MAGLDHSDIVRHSIMHWAMSLWLLLALYDTTSAIVNCPEKCNGCEVGSLSCQDGGLTRMPEQLPPDVDKIILLGHDFWDKTLRVANLSRYGSPRYAIKNIYIRSCQIRAIEPGAFVTLKNLNLLDLSNNLLTDIVPDTFKGLTLNLLKLDNNKELRLQKDSFRGLAVSSLTLTNCGLIDVPFESINAIGGSLKKLNLDNNKIKVIDPRFDVLFRQLNTLSIQDNPFHCSCELRWLAKLFAWKAKYGSVKNTFDDAIVSPVCATPLNLLNKRMHELPESSFHCEPPTLRTLDIEITSATEGRLKCIADGSASMRVHWRRYIASVSSWDYTASYSDATLKIRRHDARDHYSCLVSDKMGNVTGDVKITWPALPLFPKGHVSPKLPALPTLPPLPGDQGSQTKPDSSQKDGDSESINRPITSENYFFRKQFTLLEMIGAVVGTFTVTLAVFLLVYRFFILTHKKDRKKPSYATYETAAYSDSQIYDLPQHPPYGPPPVPAAQFLDFKTQRKLYNQV